jgi:mannose-1-phosphate guanylyltransferase
MRMTTQTWGLILAGGEGLRLRPLTRLITGDERPKQFCKILGQDTLLGQTRRRAELLIEPARTFVVLTRAHARFYGPLLEKLPPDRAIIQPQSRGTAPAILYGALRIAAEDPLGMVVILPSDHYLADDVAFMRHVATACRAVDERPEIVVLLGIAPRSPEPEYGWIEPGPPVPLHGLRRVRRFWEKPAPALARRLYEFGCLWNSFVMVARVPTLVTLFRQRLPGLLAAFEETGGSGPEDVAIERVYGQLAPINFSEDVLSAVPANLAVLPVHGLPWSDWGQPERVLKTLAELGVEPAWAAKRAAVAGSP